MHLAVKLRDIKTVKKFIEQGADVNNVNHNGWTALHFACKNMELNLIKDILNAGGNINARNKNGDTPLHIAMRGGSRPIIEFIMNKKANVNIQNVDGDTPMHILAKTKDSDRVYILFSLFKFMANPQILNNKGQRPIDIDNSLLNSEKIKWIISSAVQENMHHMINGILKYYPEFATYTALRAIYYNEVTVFKIAKNHDIDLESLVENGQTVLHRAVILCKDSRIVNNIIKAGANVNTLDGNGKSPLECILEDSFFMKPQEKQRKTLLLLNAGAITNEMQENKKRAIVLSDDFILSYLKSDVENDNLKGLRNIINNYPKFKCSRELLSFAANNNPNLAANLINNILDIKSFPWYGHIYNPFTSSSLKEQEEDRRYALAKHSGQEVLEAYKSLISKGKGHELSAVHAK